MPGKVRSALDEVPQFAVLQVSTTAAVSGTVLQQLVTETAAVGDTDEVILGISQSNNAVQDFSLRGQAMIDHVQLNVQSEAVPTARNLVETPIIHEFQYPRLVLPQMLFAFITWATAGAMPADAAVIRVWYTEREISAEDWYDLLQLRLPLGAT